jgi:hypothetical protein
MSSGNAGKGKQENQRKPNTYHIMSSKDKRELKHEDLEKIAGGGDDRIHQLSSSSASGGYRAPHSPVHHHTSSSTSLSGSGGWRGGRS